MSTALTSSNPPKVFISYSHEDENLLEELEKYLKVLQEQKIITLLHSHRTVPGIDFAKEIEKNLSIAHIVLLLVSVDFLTSYYCYHVEFERAMARHEPETVYVIPVILRPSNWMDTPLGNLQALPKGGKPIVLWDNREEAFLSVTKEIKKVAEKLRPRVSSVKKIEIKLDESLDDYDQNGFEQRLRVHVAVDLERITVSIQRGCIKLVLEGDSEELDRIVNALRDPRLRRQILRSNNQKFISYVQDQQVHSIPIGPPSLIAVLKEALRAFPAVKYALLFAVIATTVTVVAGVSSDYKLAVLILGPLTMFVLMAGLIRFSSSAIQSAGAVPSERRLSLTLTWTFVVLTTVLSLFIFTGFFFGRGPLQAYLYPGPTPSPTPTPEPSPTLTPEPSPTATITTQDPQIVVTERPPYDPVGGPASKALIAGKVSGVRPEDYCIVIYSLTNTWYVQPTTAEPRTPIGSDGTWKSVIQTGTIYAILLVPQNYDPPPMPSQRPIQLPGVVKSIEIEGKR